MANVIVSTFTNLPGGILDSFRQGFVDALIDEGNNVLLFTTNQFLSDHNASNVLASNIDKRLLIESLQNFKPDLFISVNHSGLFDSLSQSIDCPIAIWLLDGPAYLIDPEECRKQASRYHMFIATRAFRQDLNQSFCISNDNIHDLALASNFKAQEKEIAHNISFIGTNFTGHKFQEIVKQLGSNRHLIGKLRELVTSYQIDKDMIFTERTKKFALDNIFVNQFDEAYILNTVSINRRIKVLDAVEDLGLALYGTSDWPNTMKYSLGLALSFDPSPVLTRADLESIYNSSKISLNISHSQARGGLPWRVFDVMACNSVLVSDFQDDFIRLFGSDFPIPVYDSPAQAKEICERLLKDEPHRRFLVESANRIINSGHRFHHRLRTISETFNINLLPAKNGNLTKVTLDKHLDFNRRNSILNQFSDNSMSHSRQNNFSLQIFQSKLMNFSSENSELINIDITNSREIRGEFRISRALPFLRLDIGEYFSKHKNVRVTVSLADALAKSNSGDKTIDLAKDILQSHQFHLDKNELCCGFDSFCVFENPFPNQDIKLNFESSIITGL